MLLALLVAAHVRLLAFNDFHGQLGPGKLIAARPAGSAPILASWLGKYRDADTLIVHAGDLIGAWPHETSSDNFSLLMSEYLREHHLEGNVWNSYTLGAQLIHDFYPQLKPLIDSRIDVYGEPYFLYTVHMGVNEQALLDFIERYHVRYFLLTWGEFNYRIGTMPKLRENGWRMLFADHKAVLLGRELPEKR